MLRLAVLFSFVITGYLYSQQLDLSGNWEGKNETYEYDLKYSIFKDGETFNAKVFYFKYKDDEYNLEEDEQIIILKKFKYTDKKMLEGKYFDTDTNVEIDAKLKVIDKNSLELIITDGNEKFVEKISRIID